MAAIDWPWNLATIEFAGYTFGSGPDVDRTPFEDGAIRQEEIADSPMDNRNFRIKVKESNLTAFRTWLKNNGASWFNFRDFEDGTTRERRIVGGRRAVQLRGVDDGTYLDDEIYSQADVILEALPD